MIRINHLMFIFIPALITAGFGLFVGIIQYEPLHSKEEISAPSKNDTALHIPIRPEDPIIGDKKAPITLISFEDFGCDACHSLDTVFQALLKKYPKKIKIIWKGLPVTQFPYNTTRAHAYAFCAAQQKKFDAFKDRAFEQSDTLDEQTLTAIAHDIGLDENKLASCLATGNADAYIGGVEDIARVFHIQSVPAVFFHDTQMNPPDTIEGWESSLSLLPAAPAL